MNVTNNSEHRSLSLSVQIMIRRISLHEHEFFLCVLYTWPQLACTCISELVNSRMNAVYNDHFNRSE